MSDKKKDETPAPKKKLTLNIEEGAERELTSEELEEVSGGYSSSGNHCPNTNLR
jgi:hypothetical protein